MPWFPAEEFLLRLNRMRKAMEEAQIELALIHGPENICYLTGHETPGYYIYQCLAVPLRGNPVLILRETETVNAQAFTYLEDIQGYPDTVDPVDATVQALRSRGFSYETIGLEERCWFLPPADHARLQTNLGARRHVALDRILSDLRLIKSALEIESIREAARATSAAMKAALIETVAGRSERDVAAVIFSTLVREGSEYLAMEPFVASGPRSGAIHASWSSRIIRKDEPILIEIGGCVHRYHAALMRTAVTGALPAQLQGLADTCIEALSAAVETVRPGITAEAVDRACRQVIARAGMLDYYRRRTGYSIGLGFAPDWGEGHILSLRPGGVQQLAPGMVLHIVPAIRIPGIGGGGFSETVLVTPTGHEILTTVPRQLAIR